MSRGTVATCTRVDRDEAIGSIGEESRTDRRWTANRSSDVREAIPQCPRTGVRMVEKRSPNAANKRVGCPLKSRPRCGDNVILDTFCVNMPSRSGLDRIPN